MDTVTQIILNNYFTETERGLELADPIHPPSLKAFETMGLDLSKRLDKVHFKLGDWAVFLARHHGHTAYEAVAVKVGLSPQTIETQWAYTCRHVPLQARNDLSIYYHREVVSVKDTIDQRDLLDYAKKNKLNIQQFREHIARFLGKPIPPPPVSNPLGGTERDLAFELTEQIHGLENEVQLALKQAQEATERARRAEATLDTLRGRIEALVAMKPTDLMQNIGRVVTVLREVLEALSRLSPQ